MSPDKTCLLSCFTEMLIESMVSVYILATQHLIKEDMFYQNKKSELELNHTLFILPMVKSIASHIKKLLCQVYCFYFILF